MSPKDNRPVKQPTTFETLDLEDFLINEDEETISIEGLKEILFVVNNRGLAKWSFMDIERGGTPWIYKLHFRKRAE